MATPKSIPRAAEDGGSLGGPPRIRARRLGVWRDDLESIEARGDSSGDRHRHDSEACPSAFDRMMIYVAPTPTYGLDTAQTEGDCTALEGWRCSRRPGPRLWNSPADRRPSVAHQATDRHPARCSAGREAKTCSHLL